MLTFPSPSWRYCQHNLASTPSISFLGTTITAGANGVEGTALGLGSALTFDAEYLVITITGFTSAGVNSSTLLDILIDPAGGTSWATDPLVSDLLAGFGCPIAIGGTTPSMPGMSYHFPLRVPAGAALGARAKTIHTSTLAGRVAVWAFGGNRNPGTWWSGQRVQNVGIDATNCIGTSHTPGNSGVLSSWTNFGSVTGADAKAVAFAVQGVMGIAATALTYNWEFGIASNQIGPTYYKAISNGESSAMLPCMPVFAHIPAGSQLMARATCSGTAEAFDVGAYLIS